MSTEMSGKSSIKLEDMKTSSGECQNPELGAQEKDTEDTLPLAKLITVLVGLFLTMFLSALDQTIVATAMPTIGSSFDAIDKISWIATSYLLASTCVQPLSGKLSDIFGTKVTVIAATVVFVVGSVLCGAAQNMAMLIVFRAISGIGGGAILALVSIIISQLVPERDRAKYMGMMGSVFALSSVLGPILGGVFSQYVSWRWAFYINLPIGGIALAATAIYLKSAKSEGSWKTKVRRIDGLGALALVVSTICLLLAADWGSHEPSTYKTEIIVTAILAAIFLIAFIGVEWKVSPEPIIPLRFFKIRNVILVTIAYFLLGCTFYVAVYYFPVFLQAVQGQSATEAGIQLLPLLLSLVLCSIIVGMLVSRLGTYRFFISGGFAVTSAGFGLASMLNQHSSQGEKIGYFLIIGVGTGMNLQTLLMAAQPAVESKDVASVTALCTFFRTIGSVIGLAIAQTLMNTRKQSFLNKNYPMFADLATISVDKINLLSADKRNALVGAYTDGFKLVFIVLAVFSGVAFIATLLLKHIPLKSKLAKR
ncbi:hypothetical protein K7432_004552 [Basidiobolus ranarum]|uniref:MFS-type drug efflux transporter P55 n=1 Tax=Basidiobolus ranarum TaxID=34480 RepID=A0ABR2W4G7_9FUNG